MKDYLNDLLVIGIIGTIASVVFFALFKRKRLFIFIFGLLIFLGAYPAGIMLEGSVNGCCGAPRTGHQGVGIVLMAAMAAAGIAIMASSKKFSNKP